MLTPPPVLLQAETALPAAWRESGANPPALFNPAILRWNDGWIIAYRVVGSDQRRRIAVCRLTAGLSPVDGSAAPWSDTVAFADAGLSERARQWFADPRLYCWSGRLFLHWNTGWHEPRNHQFLAELDPASLLPRAPARELELRRGPRRPLEKNWLFFGRDGERLLYAPQPLCIHLTDTTDRGAILGAAAAGRDWSLPAAVHGGLRGGCPPVRVEDDWYAIGHAISGAEGGYRYEPWVVRFGPEPDYRITGVPIRPLPLPNPFGAARRAAKLNPAVGEVLYPLGADFRAGTWTISYGINDEYAAVCVLPHDVLLGCLLDYDDEA